MNIHEETLKIARNLIKKDPSLTDWVISKFPELKETKDERIKSAILGFLEGGGQEMIVPGISTKDAIAWLEQKGEQKTTVIIPRFRVGDNIKTTNEEPLTITKIDDKGYWSEDLFICGFDDAAKWEFVYQKSTDNGGPKFKVGDWVVYNDSGCICQIKSIREDDYCLWPINSNVEGYVKIIDIDNKYHLWTIQDAKDGDILAAEDKDKIFIYNGKFDLRGRVCAYCGIYKTHDGLRFTKCAIGNYFTYKEPYPATKEQRDTLMKAMTDAGWEFDFEKKELKKVEFNTDDIIEESCQQQADDLIDMVAEKSAWSEEDEKIYSRIYDLIHAAAYANYDVDEDGKELGEYAKITNWLKSLKPQNRWKPSKEQMQTLYMYAEQNSYDGAVLTSLYNDIKKL